MTPAPLELKRLSTLLDQALEMPAAQRETWLAALHGDDAALGPTLRKLLARHARHETGELIDGLPAFTVAPDPAATAAPALDAGAQVGPYRLLRELGHGGMGEVWLAERTDGHLKRPVALKLPMLSARRSVLVQRFARERDILAALAHPHIARLYDAGVADDGQPYLALEYVQGQPITAYCDEHRLDARARIALLRQVMEAVQVAHANLVIHRDLKPSNVLVTAEGQAMLLDFGIAKLLQEEQSEAAATELTQLGGRALTLGYAAPEQVTGTAVSIATDVYALGVLLYELLAGQRPFVADTRAALEHAVLQQEPQRPSQHKAGVMAAMPRTLRADLDTIALKALKKAPAERYATVNALIEDLDRFASGQPVLAQPDSRWYRTRKFIVRHRVPVAASTLATAALIAVSIVALLQAAEAKRQATAATSEAKRAQTVQSFLIDLFQASSTNQPDPQAAQRTTARELLDRGAKRVDAALTNDPPSHFEMLRVLADIYWQLDLPEQAASLERRRVELARQQHGARDSRLAKVLLDYAETIQENESRDEIPALVDEALKVLHASGEGESEMRGQALEVAANYWRHVSLQRSLQAADEAVAFLRQHHPASDRLVGVYMHAARMRILSGDLDAAIANAERSVEAAGRKGDGAAAWSWMPVSTLADALWVQLSLDRAEVELRRELALALKVHGEVHGRTLTSKARLGNLLFEIGQAAEAETLHQAVRAALTQQTGMNPIQREYIAGILGLRELERGRPDRLRPILRADLEELQRTLPRSPLVASRLRLWALLQSALRRDDEARSALQSSQRIWDAFAAGAPSKSTDALYAISHAQVDIARGAAQAALVELERAPPFGRRNEIAHPVERARALVALGRHDDAARAATEALARIDLLPATHRPVALEADARLLRGESLLAGGNAAAAEADLKAALRLRQRHDAPDSLWVAQAQIVLARCQLALGRRDDAGALLASAQRTHAMHGDDARAHADALRLLVDAMSRSSTAAAGRVP